MKHIATSLLAIAATFSIALGETQPEGLRTAGLHQDLTNLYHQVATGVSESNIVGQTIDVNLALRRFSGKLLLFEGTAIRIDKTTSYQFIKWQFKF